MQNNTSRVKHPRDVLSSSNRSADLTRATQRLVSVDLPIS
jgi:hypothetical protein